LNIPQTKSYTPTKKVPTSIPWCYIVKVISVVEEKTATAPFFITVKYISPATGEIITRGIAGLWKGFIYTPIQTNVSNTEIAGCKDWCLVQFT
jgi:hypothetical protein